MVLKINRNDNEIGIERLEVSVSPSLWNYGTMKDYCCDFNAHFYSGNAYGLIGECGSGGWAISWILAGREKVFNGVIKMNDSVADSKMLAQKSCYVGEGVEEHRSRSGYKKTSILKQIEKGIKLNGGGKEELDEILNLFALDSEKSRLNRSIYNISNLRWRASIAIGYAYQKEIFCFPWLNTGWMKFVLDHIGDSIEILKKVVRL